VWTDAHAAHVPGGEVWIGKSIPGDETPERAEAIRAALEEYAVECSAAKVLASEELGMVMDEAVQVHGGYGFIEDLPIAAHYRGTRVDRIWEGTNEINRLLISGTLLRRAQRGRLDLLGAARRAWDSLLEAEPEAGPGGPLAAERSLADGVRRLGLVLAGAAARRFGEGLEEEQEVLAGLADLAIHLLAMEGAVVRAEQAAAEDPARAEVHLDLARAVAASRVGPAELTARALVARVAEGDDARLLRTGIRRLLRAEPPEGFAVGRRVAEAVLEAGGYPLDL
jgi:hypothetical protein